MADGRNEFTVARAAWYQGSKTQVVKKLIYFSNAIETHNTCGSRNPQTTLSHKTSGTMMLLLHIRSTHFMHDLTHSTAWLHAWLHQPPQPGTMPVQLAGTCAQHYPLTIDGSIEERDRRTKSWEKLLKTPSPGSPIPHDWQKASAAPPLSSEAEESKCPPFYRCPVEHNAQRCTEDVDVDHVLWSLPQHNRLHFQKEIFL